MTATCTCCHRPLGDQRPPAPHGLLIRQRREERGLTREQLVDKVDGLSVRTLLAIEVHGRMPRVRTLASIAKELGLSLDDLIGEPQAAAS